MRDPTPRHRHTQQVWHPPKALMTTALFALMSAVMAGTSALADGDTRSANARTQDVPVPALERTDDVTSRSRGSAQAPAIPAERMFAAEGDDEDGDDGEGHATTESRLAAAQEARQAASGGSGGKGKKDIEGADGAEDVAAGQVEEGSAGEAAQDEAAVDATAAPEQAAEDGSGAANGECVARTAEEDAHENDAHWTYEGEAGPEHWAELSPKYEKCGTGTRQTPIDLASSEVVPMGLEDVEFQYASAEASVVNNGHTIQVTVPEGNAIVLDGVSYGLVQFHFHTPSEHTIDGASYPLELHLVHKDESGNLAVVGVMLEKGEKNPVLSQIWGKSLPKSEGKEVALKSPLELSALLPSDRAAYRYLGSLTTPPCSEGVKWIVMKSSVTMTTKQIAAFKKLFPMNARPLQPINARSIVEDVTHSTHAAN
ncbi:MAG: carbonic anhydrase family protein [Gammaproteobacteria bacterium]